MKSIRTTIGLRRAVVLVAAVAAMGCASASSSTAATAPTSATPTSSATTGRPVFSGPIERTQFDPSLGIHLEAMIHRPSGLYVQDLVTGTGAVATLTKTVVVQYTGWLSDGKEFDSGEITVTLGSNQTIRAWEDGLLGMRVGGKRRLVVPPSMGYGGAGAAGGGIPPNAVLVFEMEMKSVS